MSQSNIGSRQAIFVEMSSKKHSFANHPLREQSEYLQDLYLSMLCAVAQCDGEMNEAEVSFVTKLLSDMGKDVGIERYVKRTYENINGLITAFITDFDQMSLLYHFLVDAILLSSVDEGLNEQEIDFLTLVSEECHLDELQFDFLVSFSLALIEQDEKKYLKLILLRPEELSLREFLSYLPFPRTRLIDAYVQQVLNLTIPLHSAKRYSCDLLQYKGSLGELAGQLYEQVMPHIEEVETELDRIGGEIREITGGWLEISDDNDEWTLKERCWKISEISDHLFVDIAGQELMGEVMKAGPKEQLNQLIDHINAMINYVEELKYTTMQ